MILGSKINSQLYFDLYFLYRYYICVLNKNYIIFSLFVNLDILNVYI